MPDYTWTPVINRYYCDGVGNILCNEYDGGWSGEWVDRAGDTHYVRDSGGRASKFVTADEAKQAVQEAWEKNTRG